MLSYLWKHRHLIYQLTKRDINTRYKGSFLGLVWTFLTPLFMLVVYTFVFGVVFQAKWDVKVQNNAEFALILFCGLTAYNIFADTISAAPTIVLNNPSYIKKVVFPLEILPVTVLGTALFNASISLVILVIANVILRGELHWTLILLPIVLVPVIFLALSLGWLLSSIGVFFRDIKHVIPLLVMSLLFLSPIFYPIQAIPEEYRFMFSINPLSLTISDTRNVLIWGEQPNWEALGMAIVSTFCLALVGFYWFKKTKKGFADVA